MRNTIRYFGALTAFLAAGLVTQTPASAQGTLTLSAPTISPAEQLEQQAEQPVAHDNWLPVAAELEKAARLRGVDDPTALNDLMAAATLYASVGRPTIALSILDEVATRAEKVGAFDIAARAYDGAVPLALQNDDADRAGFYVGRIEALAKRPDLPPAQKHAILGLLGMSNGDCR